MNNEEIERQDKEIKQFMLDMTEMLKTLCTKREISFEVVFYHDLADGFNFTSLIAGKTITHSGFLLQGLNKNLKQLERTFYQDKEAK